MIVGKLHAPQASARLEEALRAFLSVYSDDLAPGKYALSGDDFFNVKNNTTRDFADCRFEMHEDYADVQLVLHGAECLAYRQRGEHEQPVEQAGGDCWLFADTASCDQICLTDGMFAVFFPGELHKPNVQLGPDPQNRKVIIKLKGFTEP